MGDCERPGWLPRATFPALFGNVAAVLLALSFHKEEDGAYFAIAGQNIVMGLIAVLVAIFGLILSIWDALTKRSPLLVLLCFTLCLSPTVVYTNIKIPIFRAKKMSE